MALIVVGVGIGSFFLGRASIEAEILPQEGRDGVGTVIQAEEPRGEVRPLANEPNEESTVSPGSALPTQGGYVASKGGTKYHLPWCSGAKRIKEENKIWFGTKEEAEAAGYTPAANCKGI